MEHIIVSKELSFIQSGESICFFFFFKFFIFYFEDLPIFQIPNCEPFIDTQSIYIGSIPLL